jgi:hypothetical protein
VVENDDLGRERSGLLRGIVRHVRDDVSTTKLLAATFLCSETGYSMTATDRREKQRT